MAESRIREKADAIDEWIPLQTPDLRGREAEYLAECVRTNWVSSAGPFVTQLEQRLADLCRRRHAIAVVNGTAALHLTLVAARIKAGDRVVVPDWTFAATANAVMHAGAEPVFADIRSSDWTLDPQMAKRAIAEHKAKAVIAVDTLGMCADYESLSSLCAETDTLLIEDAAGAIGASSGTRPAGGFGSFAVLSFNGNKTVTAGGGGMILTDDDRAAAKLRHLSTQARIGGRYRYDAVGWNYRMTNVNAAIALAQLERLTEMVEAKREVADAYAAALAGRTDLCLMPRPDRAGHSCWLSCILCASREDAERLIDHLADAGIEARVFWESLSAQPPYAHCRRALTGIAENLSGRVASLPSSSHLTPGELERVSVALAAWSGRSLSGSS